jgi:hypothetical protein
MVVPDRCHKKLPDMSAGVSSTSESGAMARSTGLASYFTWMVRKLVSTVSSSEEAERLFA